MRRDAPDNTVKLYESCAFERLLGDTLRPGGLKLTARLANTAGIQSSMQVLDTACGKGTTSLFLAREYGCRVTGIDLSEQMISLAESRAAAEGLTGMARFCHGDVEDLPFQDESFDVVISECAFSLMPDKPKAAVEIHRVLKKSGKLAMTDIVLRGKVDDALRSRLHMAYCMSGAVSAEEYMRLFARAGFHSPYQEDHSEQLRKVAFQMGIAFGSMGGFMNQIPAGPCRCKTSAETHHSAQQAYMQFVKQGRPGYILLVMTRDE
ncbi:MAG: methyltransferase domain-containing protein [Desulfomonilia bacterium]|nr:methyltransferase domain-containing protein [Desulfomonilia bacterium]